MAGCCHDDDCAASALAERQARMLWVVLAINAVMFVVEFGAGWVAGSTALLGDSLDMLGDALVYGFSLVAVARGARWKAASAGLKGGIMAAFGIAVLLEAGAKALWGVAPASGLMAGIGVLVLLANAACLVVLTRHRGDDVNMSSAWVCSRNDIVANVGVLVAAGAVALTASPWPDILVGTAVALLFLRSAVRVLGDARRSWDAAPAG
ncbi:Zinc transporter ZitB [wastewater metagenome]|uniref:Zinc transporter ZitB n=2 Tax=unclassified sequences TaxID=12908 RepID=A0A5B8RBH4_9ZZZZ|nr:cation transporter [Arhodomonas aquaeolei]MCS4505136.1 cation transporter [Arhodomonas aquaeolei]QEA04037.1 zinc transporter ZitB [uncultured organism]